MNENKLGCTVFAIAAILLAISTLNIFNKRENFGEVEDYSPGNRLAMNNQFRGSTANKLSNAAALQSYQDRIRVNIGTQPDKVDDWAAKYYSELQNYLNPSMNNLELCQNINPRPIMGGSSVPGSAMHFSNKEGDGFVDNLGYLGNEAFPPVSYENERAAQLSNCAKNLPMFAASSLLPKISTNSSNNALSQSAARALAAFTALSPVEQLGAITSNKTPYSKTTDLRETVPLGNVQSWPVGSASAVYTTPTFGQSNNRGNVARNGLVGPN